jgi:hypothetical protein
MRILFFILLLWCSNVDAVPNYVSLRPLMLGYIPSSMHSPLGEFFSNAFDGDPTTKYLNFDKLSAGVMIKLSQGKVISQVQFTTANDSPERDPASFSLFGSNDTSGGWTLITSQLIALPNNRLAVSPVYPINNTEAYVYYNITFPIVKDAGAANSMQIADIVLSYDENDPTTSIDLGSTLPWTTFPSVYCCGGSAAPFPQDMVSMVRMIIFKQSPNTSYVGINQTGNDNKITIEQIGSSKHLAAYNGNGNSNTITITQTAANDLQPNFTDLTVNGNFNLVSIDQNSYSVVSNSGKGAFINITDDNNYFTLQQKDNGNHIAYVSLSGGNKHVDILQQGAANHMTDITLSGQPVDLSLQQSGATQQYYSINFNCATAGGCAPIQVQQGQ